MELFLDRYAYVVVLALLAIGLYGMLAIGNLAKKLVGMVIFTTAIYLFFITGSQVVDGAPPIIDDRLGTDPAAYADPLPHLLILTAIVVGVGVLGVGLALLVRIHRAHGTFDEAIVADRLSGRGRPIGADPDDPPAAHGDGDDGDAEAHRDAETDGRHDRDGGAA
ncbi:cation:proton antiporter subunit C [Nitriliruptoraceae bacterium ZYF776]|nr:cation:proton antiporter subunit C [Profundirhabdus halotolerans]